MLTKYDRREYIAAYNWGKEFCADFGKDSAILHLPKVVRSKKTKPGKSVREEKGFSSISLPLILINGVFLLIFILCSSDGICQHELFKDFRNNQAYEYGLCILLITPRTPQLKPLTRRLIAPKKVIYCFR